MLTSNPRRTLRLAWPEKKYLVMAVALVVAFNPLVNALRPIVESLFPISSVVKTTLAQIMAQAPGLVASVVVFALIPAICEEFAFRGFILSGLEERHRTRSAILLSALMFGFLHVLLSLFQQLFNATLLGLVLGLLAVRSRSILPGIVFHFLNNAFAVALASVAASSMGRVDHPCCSIATPSKGFIMNNGLRERAGIGILAVYLVEMEAGTARRAGGAWFAARRDRNLNRNRV